MNIRKIALLFFAAVIAFGVLPNSSHGKIVVGLSSVNVAFLPVYVTEDRGFFKDEGLDVSIDDAATPVEPITRVAGGGYDMALADINALIRYRDQHPSPPIKAVFVVFNKPPYAIVARKSRGITEPKQLEGKKLGAPPAGSTFAQWPLFAKLNGIDVSKVAIENIEPQLIPQSTTTRSGPSTSPS